MKHITAAALMLMITTVGLDTAWAGQPPLVELVDVYHCQVDLADYGVSEKYDGVRGYWDGHEMRTRGSSVTNLPRWFITSAFPSTPMDGELWAGYAQFSTASTRVRTAGPHDPGWHDISYRVFDLPGRPDACNARVPAIRRVVARIHKPRVVAIRQFHLADDKALHAALEEVLARAGGSLVLHRGSRDYTPGRHAGLLKVKPYEGAEARVIAVHPGP